MIYYKSKYLAKNLKINLSKWKRWSREFLPPDTLGGLQSGVARQFNLKEAFKVYLGGYLVGDLKFTIPEAGKILTDLGPWLKTQGFYQLNPQIIRNGHDAPSEHHIYIYSPAPQHFGYTIRTIIVGVSPENDDIRQEKYSQTLIHTRSDPIRSGKVVSAQVIVISTLYLMFLERIHQT